MLLEHRGERPTIDPSARIAPNAVICGDVTIGPDCSVGFGAVLTAESGPITLGRSCVVMENAVLRGTKRAPLRIGDHVLIGPHATLSGCTVESSSFIATGVAVFNHARIGRESVVRIGAVVHVKTVLPPQSTVPIQWVAVGDPAEILPPDQEEAIWARQGPLNFTKTVFGLEPAPTLAQALPEALARYTRALQSHRDDSEL